ncbi:MAG: TVP38/TMEM64 family protein [Pseudomonadota bacterium]
MNHEADVQNAPPTQETPRAPLFVRLAPLIVIAGALAAFFFFGLHRYFSLDVLQENRAAATAWVAANPTLALAAFVGAYATVVAISFPGASILTIFGGFLFGVWPGVPAIVTGATLGAFVIFVAAKTAFSGLLARKAGGLIERMERGFRDNELSYMFLLRLVPLFPFWAVNIAAGVANVKTANYLLATFFGIIPATFVYAGVGATIGDAFDAGEAVSLEGVLANPQTLAIIGVFSVLAIAPIFVKRRKTDAEG